MAGALLATFLLGLSVFAAAEVKNGFSGYKLYAVMADTEKQMDLLMKMDRMSETYGLHDEVDFWTDPSMAVLEQKGSVMLMLSPHRQSMILQAFEEYGIKYECTINDIAKAIEDESKLTRFDQRARAAGQMTWTAYQPYEVIENYVKDLARDYPNIVSIETLGQSYEGRNLYLLKIGKAREDGKTKPAVWMDSHIHAREWITSATTTFMVNKLVTQYETNSTSRRMLDEVDFYYLPVVNPDGYEHTRSSQSTRLWRKTRKINPFSECIGVDPNRNYDYFWMYDGANQSPCGDIYAGPYGFSEAENIHLSEGVLKRKEQIKVLLTVHSAAQMWLTPWGYGLFFPPDNDDILEMGNRAVHALTSQFGTRYRVGSSTVLLGPSGGATDDWGKGKAMIKYAYTVELRDNGRYSFLLPPEFIIPSGVETFEALVVVADMVSKEFGPTLD